ncbi:hypothetical protein AOLI_G00109590 [Acnodon oligacanthus]
MFRLRGNNVRNGNSHQQIAVNRVRALTTTACTASLPSSHVCMSRSGEGFEAVDVCVDEVEVAHRWLAEVCASGSFSQDTSM